MNKIFVFMVTIFIIVVGCVTTPVENQHMAKNSEIDEYTRFSDGVLNVIKDVISKPMLFSVGGQKAQTVYVEIGLESVERITNDEIFSLKNNQTAKYVLSSEHRNIYTFKANFFDLFTGKEYFGYFGINEFGMLDFNGSGPKFPENNKDPEISLYFNDLLLGKRPVNPEIDENLSSYYLTLETEDKAPLVVVAMYANFKQYESNFWITVTNKTQKEILGFNGFFILYNKFGERLKYPVTDTFGFQDDSLNLKPDSLSVTIGSWDLYLAQGVRKIVPIINKVYFKDGTIWERNTSF